MNHRVKALQYLLLGNLILFFGCYFLKYLMQKIRGIRTDHMGEGKSGFVKFVEVSLKIFTAILPFMDAVSIIMNIHTFEGSYRLWGAAVSLSGTVIFIISVITMKDSWRAGVSLNEKTDLVTDGIYSCSRNPAFLGFDLLFIGNLISFFSWYLLVFTAITVFLFHLQIVNVEEDHLICTFGNEYTEYMKSVRRYFGRKQK